MGVLTSVTPEVGDIEAVNLGNIEIVKFKEYTVMGLVLALSVTLTPIVITLPENELPLKT